MFRTFSFDDKSGEGFGSIDAIDRTKSNNNEVKKIPENKEVFQGDAFKPSIEKANPDKRKEPNRIDFSKLSREIGEKVLEKAYLPQNPFEAKSKFKLFVKKCLLLMFNE